MSSSCCRVSAARHYAPGHRLRLRTAQPVVHREATCFGVVPVGERNGWWLKRPQPNLLDASGLEDIVRISPQMRTSRIVDIQSCRMCLWRLRRQAVLK